MTQLLLYLYTIDSWLAFEINSGSREGDSSKVDTLGPFAYAFGAIIDSACRFRKDISDLKETIENKGIKLYRGTGLTKKELMNYTYLMG